METTKQEEQLMSLYEFLGRPAGLEGQKCYEAAKKAGIKCGNKPVINKKFTGNVLTYPKAFLQGYFNQSSSEDEAKIMFSKNQDDDNLPF